MNILDIIEKKKNGEVLTESELNYFVESYTDSNSKVKDYQASSLLMAILLNGMNKDETYYLTKAMLENSGSMKLKPTSNLIVDKHSSGGIGDKVTLIITPLLVSLGYNVAKMSGRGLSFTGGTIDKLDSIDVKSNFSIEQAIKELDNYGMFIMSQTSDIAQADKKLYALRDVTGTVDSTPLIVSSILSKKLCINSDIIVLDIKVGSGAFFKTISEAKYFCKYAKYVLEKFKRQAIIYLTNMDVPLGYNVGNKVEIIESLKFLDGQQQHSKLKDLIYSILTDILLYTRKASDKIDATKKIDQVISNKNALNTLLDYFKGNGSKIKLLNYDNWFFPDYKIEIFASKSGFLQIKDASVVGLISLELGAGRKSKDDKLDFDAGIVFNVKNNSSVKQGELIATLYSTNKIKKEIVDKFEDNLTYTEKQKKSQKIIFKTIKIK